MITRDQIAADDTRIAADLARDRETGPCHDDPTEPDTLPEVATPALTPAALACLQETGGDDPDLIASDVARLRSGDLTPESLLAECLDGADDDRHAGWIDYVNACAELAGV